MSAFTIARLTFREASRRWILWAALLLGVIFLIIFGLGFNSLHQEVQLDTSRNARLPISELYNFFLMAGLYVVNFMSVLMTVLTSVDTLSGEIATGTIHTIVSKPVRRWEVVVGKWLGFAGMLSLYLLLMAGGVMAIIYLISGYVAPNPLRGLGLIWLNVLMLLGVTLLGGSMLSTLTNGVLVFGLYSLAFIGGWIEQFAWLMSLANRALNVQPAMTIGILCSLILPSEALWRRAAYEMQSPVVSAFGGFSFFSSGSVPSPLMVVYALAYAGIVLLLAIRQFNKRDL
jgi:ABC-type transport system involved in multi-copper enzyme maturation permease subunit